jgi:hypothetical protein
VHGILGLRLLVVLFSVAVVCIYRGKPPRVKASHNRLSFYIKNALDP